MRRRGRDEETKGVFASWLRRYVYIRLHANEPVAHLCMCTDTDSQVVALRYLRHTWIGDVEVHQCWFLLRCTEWSVNTAIFSPQFSSNSTTADLQTSTGMLRILICHSLTQDSGDSTTLLIGYGYREQLRETLTTTLRTLPLYTILPIPICQVTGAEFQASKNSDDGNLQLHCCDVEEAARRCSYSGVAVELHSTRYM